MPAITHDTIVALATPPGLGALAVIRISGEQALAILRQLAPQRRQHPSHHLSRCCLRNRQGQPLDEVMVVAMHRPQSFTGEDVVELFLHGAPVVSQQVIDEVIALGGRLATPGEFTARAYANGRLNLLQVEAIDCLLHAEDSHQAIQATQMLQGKHTLQWQHIYDGLSQLLAELTAICDFPEYVEEETSTSSTRSAQVLVWLQWLRNQRAEAVLQSQNNGDIIVLCGPPNAGKSTLLNALLGEDRLLVDYNPGTTRDAVEVRLNMKTGTIRLMDTAGLWSTPTERVDIAAVARTNQLLKQHSRVVWVLPVTRAVEKLPLGAQVIATKCDQADAAAVDTFAAAVVAQGGTLLAAVAALTGWGMANLRSCLESWARSTAAPALTVRQAGCIHTAMTALERAVDDLPDDLLRFELAAAHQAIAELLGYQKNDQMLKEVFSRFCIGK